MPISVLSGNSTKILGTGAYTYDASQNLMVYSNRSLHVDAGEPNSYYISGSTFSDLTGRGINGTLTNSFSGTNPTFSQFNGGYFNFNGFKGGTPATGNSFIEFNADQLPSGNQPSTIITWARCSGYLTANRYIFSYGNFSSDQARYLGVNTSGRFIVGGFAASELVSNSTVTLNKWFQLTFVHTGTSILVYVNGVVDGSLTRSLITFVTNKKARIGRQITTDGPSVNNADGYWYGDISEVIVYDRVLNPQEIYQDYKVKRYRYGLGEVTRPTDNSEPTVPSVTTISITGTTTTSTLSGVQVDSDGNSNITASGVIWSTSNANLTTVLTTKTTNGTGNITGLSPGVLYYVRAYATNAQGTSYGNILPFTSTAIVLPSVIAITASYTGNSAFATGSVTGLGNATSVSARGFVWNISTINPNTADSITTTRVTESGPFVTGEYGLTISPLTPNTTYYVRAFATNTANTSGTTNTPGTTYSSEQLVFKTYAFATVTVPIITNITGVSFDASITTTGQLITRQGIIWKTSLSDPNVSNDLNNTQPGGAGTYPSTIDSQVNPNTTYYVYGYVENIAGISYSTVRIVTTDNFALVTTDAVDINNIANKSATVSGSLDNMNGSTVTDIGFVWTDDVSFLDSGLDIDNYTGIYTKTTGISVGAFTYKIAGLSELTNYYVKAYATNAVGTSYGDAQPFTTFGTPIVSTNTPILSINTNLQGSIQSLGGFSTVEVGFQYWVTSIPANVTTVMSTNEQTTTGFFAKKVSLSPSTTYTVRSYVTCPLGTFYGSSVIFTTLASLPTVSTGTPTNITSTSANIIASVTDDGGSSVTAGICYATTTTPTIANSVFPSGSGIGNFNTSITGLTSNTTYYARAYATNASGTVYGIQVSLTTFAITTGTIVDIFSNKIGVTGSYIDNILSTPPITARGVVWSINQDPIVTLTTKTLNGSGTGTFSSPNVQILSASTLYYIRAYATTNTGGTFYGNQITFTTPANPTIVDLKLSSTNYRDSTKPLQSYNYYNSNSTVGAFSFQELLVSVSTGASSLWNPGFVFSTSVSNINSLIVNAANTFNILRTGASRLDSAGGTTFYAGPGQINFQASLRPWYVRAYLYDGLTYVYSNVIREVNLPILLFSATNTTTSTPIVTVTVNSMRPGTTPLPVINAVGYTLHPSIANQDVSGTITNIIDTDTPILNGSFQFSQTINIASYISPNTRYALLAWAEYTSVDGTIRVHTNAAIATRPAV